MKSIAIALIISASTAALAGCARAAADSLVEGVAENPVIWADVPDPDVIRVGDDYYIMSTTMHLMPGAPVMHSRDMVSWRTIGYVFDTLDDNPGFGLADEGNTTVYGKGQWATSLRYHDGRFYALFSPNDEPYRSYVYTTVDPAGKWELVSRMPHFHDASLLFDDDGRVYVYSDAGNIRLTELLPDLSDVKPGGVSTTVVFADSTETNIHEGSRAVKHDGKYYLFVISWPAGQPRRQLCYRADSITGPYEKKVVLESEFGGFPYVGQGCIFDGADGRWWGMIFQDRGAVGRVPTLNPVTWTDGWPMLGDAEGHVPAQLTLPLDTVAGGRASVVSSDDFSSPRLGLDWQWNHNPDSAGWSLAARPGYLRLTPQRTSASIFHAPNTLSQRAMGPECSVVTSLDASGMNPGDFAGLGMFNGHSALLSVAALEGGAKELRLHTPVVNFAGDTKRIESVSDTILASVPMTADTIALRVDCDFRPRADLARFSYSTDGGASWEPVGEPFRMRYDWQRLFMGSRPALYHYSTAMPGGHTDFDYYNITY